MRSKIPLAPREPDVTVYIVLNDFGPLGRAYVETDEAAEGWARDVSEDIARAVLVKACDEDRSIGIAAQEFLVRALGVEAPTGD